MQQKIWRKNKRQVSKTNERDESTGSRGQENYEQGENSENKEKRLPGEKKNSNILHSDVLGFKKRSAKIEFYTQLNYNFK